MRSTRSTSSCFMVSAWTRTGGLLQSYLQSPCSSERKWRNSFTTPASYVDRKHVLPAFIKNLHDGNCMLLQRWVRELIDSLVSFVAGIINCLRDILNVFVNSLLVCGRGVRVGANEVDEGLDTLDKEGCLIFKIVLRVASIGCGCRCRLGTYLELEHAAVVHSVGTIHADALTIVAAVGGAIGTVRG